MEPVETFLSRLRGVRGKGPWRAVCPAHDSKHDSRTLSVSQGADGRVLIHCFAGCEVPDIAMCVGMTVEQLFPPRAALGADRHYLPPARKTRWPLGHVTAAYADRQLRIFLTLRDILRDDKTLSTARRAELERASEDLAAMILEVT